MAVVYVLAPFFLRLRFSVGDVMRVGSRHPLSSSLSVLLVPLEGRHLLQAVPTYHCQRTERVT